ncbi:hypothetical protein [Maribellus maritimus]|uniref:hypothetical protein n=1 Tax=Maribellus maritimus TaxID=2870838 RepID=UPI001EEBBFD3|nr:hypothetical protein [Maribellus maritimus]MCG6190841.1 hypothetical protein [Maribellus maritimus]
MYLTKKNIENIDIVGAFIHCPFNQTTNDCPFLKYHHLQNPDKQMNAFHMLSDEEIQSLRIFHRNCVKERSEKEKYPEYSF